MVAPYAPPSAAGQLANFAGLSPSLHAQAIANSHERCRAFGLVSTGSPDLGRLAPEPLRELQARNARLCAQALPVMDMLYEQLMHAQSMVLLTDASGTILHALGDPGFLGRAQQVALAPGALWAEADKGTNAVGTALMTEAPTLVHGQEHYLKAMQFLTCSAAPIFDHRGGLLGVIDVSGDRRSYHPHTLALAGMSARMIEAQWFVDRFRHSMRLHFHAQPQALGTLREAVLALDEDGRILGANRPAMDLLALTPAALRRETVGSLLGCGLGALAEAGRRCGEEYLRLRLPQRGEEEMFLKLCLPQSGLAQQRAVAQQEFAQDPTPAREAMPSQAAAPVSHSLREAEAQTIQAAVLAAAGNLSLAARQLGIGRSTLYRKLREVGPRS
ncbi:sigma-54-dependent Fis family transcriptional regulator [Paucibacter soli]|uniref:sigma-54-dependent Fis family transcriptional regulator n=1 Tax=Paucibacter soli TaxID=3133433 RepID=UPI00309C3EAA